MARARSHCFPAGMNLLRIKVHVEDALPPFLTALNGVSCKIDIFICFWKICVSFFWENRKTEFEFWTNPRKSIVWTIFAIGDSLWSEFIDFWEAFPLLNQNWMNFYRKIFWMIKLGLLHGAYLLRECEMFVMLSSMVRLYGMCWWPPPQMQWTFYDSPSHTK